jgi:2-polyprenyl-3-methyl-5-hydroxy-6-metoxy-1,4-benzoquinol methylase
MTIQIPTIVDYEADQRFKSIATRLNLNPDSPWVGGYVEYEWEHGRFFFQRPECEFANASILEFGCNVGATAVILAFLGARVTAIDVDKQILELAKANAQRYGVAQDIDFLHVPDTTSLPFDSETFDYVSCNSVLEYVDRRQLPLVQQEINRMVKKHGVLFLMGTSNRLWPREIHSKRWFVNYIPSALDNILYKGKHVERGVSPWRVLNGFGNYENLDLQDQAAFFLECKRKMGLSADKLLLLKTLQRILSVVGMSIGLIMPNIFLTLQKR